MESGESVRLNGWMKNAPKWQQSSRFGLVFLLITALTTVLLLLRPRAVLVSINRNGIPSVWGVPLKNMAVRDLAFRGLKWSKVTIGVSVPPSIDPATAAGTNMLETLDGINKAGLLSLAPAPMVSPYE